MKEKQKKVPRVMKPRTVGRILAFAKMSIPINAITAVGKITLSFFYGSLFLLLNAFYSVGIALAKGIALNPGVIKKLANRGKNSTENTAKDSGDNTAKDNSENVALEGYYAVGIIIVIASICYALYSVTFFFGKNSSKYPELIGIAIATFTFTELFLSIRGFIMARKSKNIQIEALKLTNLASSLISVVLTQTAILSFAFLGEDKMQIYVGNGISGVIFGTLACLVGVYMIVFTIKSKRLKK